MKYFILFFSYLLFIQTVNSQTKELDSKYVKNIKSTPESAFHSLNPPNVF